MLLDCLDPIIFRDREQVSFDGPFATRLFDVIKYVFAMGTERSPEEQYVFLARLELGIVGLTISKTEIFCLIEVAVLLGVWIAFFRLLTLDRCRVCISCDQDNGYKGNSRCYAEVSTIHGA